MKLHVFGSGSKGNCYVLEAADSALLLECGISSNKITRDNLFEKIILGVCSHSHSDHSKYLSTFLKRGMKVINNVIEHHNSVPIYNKQKITCKEWRVIPLKMVHDVECYGFLINHPECGNVLFVTDTKEIPYKLSGVNHFIVESNFGQEILDNKQVNHKINHNLATRIENSHMSFEKCKEFLKGSYIEDMQTITVVHLSDSNSDCRKFTKELKEEFGVPVSVAKEGEVINLGF